MELPQKWSNVPILCLSAVGSLFFLSSLLICTHKMFLVNVC